MKSVGARVTGPSPSPSVVAGVVGDPRKGKGADAREEAFAAAARPVKRGARQSGTVMDDGTDEEFTRSIWVDDDTGEEIKEEDALSRRRRCRRLGEDSAKKSAAPRSPAKPAEKKKIDAPAKVSKGIASFFGKK